MRRPVVLTEYFKDQAKKAYAKILWKNSEDALARLTAWIDRRGGTIKAPDLLHYKKAKNRKEALEKLQRLHDEEIGILKQVAENSWQFELN